MLLEESSVYLALEREALDMAEAQPGRAAELMAGLAERWPERIRPARLCARLLMKGENYDAAIPWWNRVARLAPGDVEPLLSLARIYQRTNRAAEALASLSAALEANPGHREALGLRASIAEREIASLTDRIAASGGKAFRERVEKLKPFLGSDPRFARLEAYARHGANRSAGMSEAGGHERATGSMPASERSGAGFPPSAERMSGTEARLDAVRLLEKTGQFEALADEALAILADYSPFEERDREDQLFLIEIVRRLCNATRKSSGPIDLSRHANIVGERNPPAALRSWMLGTIAAAQPDARSAQDHFRAAKDQGLDETLGVSADAEIAGFHAWYQEFGKARAAAATIAPTLRASAEYRDPLRRVEEVMEFCGEGADPYYPECLIDVILDEIARAPIRYEFEKGNLITVVSSLRQGGSERQTVTVLERMARDERLASVSLAVRFLEDESERFFLDAVRRMPVRLFVYGRDWRKKAPPLAELPEFAGRERLTSAIELLPHNMRESVTRLCKLFFRERPQAVHLRQDLYGAALACAIAGVPRFLIHRGSLSPNLWEHTEVQAAQQLRPMRHTYRRLLGRGEFLIVNNSAEGGETDRAWLDWEDGTSFKVVHNAVEFERLGKHVARNIKLRTELGIGVRKPVVGGVFRIEPVKRPMLWIETAARIAKAVPAAHFVIAGDGSMMETLRHYAQEKGFSARLHMPGRVSNIGEWYRIMDVNLLTSEREGLPNTLIEGQHFGVPAISSDVGGARETLEPGITGHLLPAEAGSELFAEKVIAVLRDWKWRAEARARAPAFVHAKFSAQRTVDEVLGCLGVHRDGG